MTKMLSHNFIKSVAEKNEDGGCVFSHFSTALIKQICKLIGYDNNKITVLKLTLVYIFMVLHKNRHLAICNKNLWLL